MESHLIELWDCLSDLVRAHDVGMGKKPVALRIELARDALDSTAGAVNVAREKQKTAEAFADGPNH